MGRLMTLVDFQSYVQRLARSRSATTDQHIVTGIKLEVGVQLTLLCEIIFVSFSAGSQAIIHAAGAVTVFEYERPGFSSFSQLNEGHRLTWWPSLRWRY